MKTNTTNNNVNFGMALYLPKKSKIVKQFGIKMAEEVEAARPKLQQLTKDVDLYVSIVKCENKELEGFSLHLTPILTSPVQKFFFGSRYEKFKKNPLIRLCLGIGPRHEDLNALKYEINKKSMSNLLVDKAAMGKKFLLDPEILHM